MTTKITYGIPKHDDVTSAASIVVGDGKHLRFLVTQSAVTDYTEWNHKWREFVSKSDDTCGWKPIGVHAGLIILKRLGVEVPNE